MSSNILVVISGPSGSGKSTLVQRIVSEYDDFVYSISATTRKPRAGEEEGRDYFFVSNERFQEMIKQNELIEWAEVYGKFFYGTPRTFITETLKTKNIIIDIDVQGGLQIMDQLPEALFVFIKTGDIDILEKRIRGRAPMSEDELQARLHTAQTELALQDKYHHTIVNDSLEPALKQLKEIIEQRKAQ